MIDSNIYYFSEHCGRFDCLNQIGENVVRLVVGADGSLDVFISNSHGVTGFQFDIDGMDLSGASGASAEAPSFNVGTGPNGESVGPHVDDNE